MSEMVRPGVVPKEVIGQPLVLMLSQESGVLMEGFEGAHDALADVKATARCFWKMKYMGLINSVIL